VRAKSLIRRKRDAEAKPFRDALVEQVGECEHCGCSPTNRRGKMEELARIAVHEIADGPDRAKAQDKPYAVLVLCWECNSGQFKKRDEWPEARQLALLAQRRPLDFNLSAYLELTSPNAPRRIEIEEVLDWLPADYLTKQEIATRLNVDRRTVQNWITSGQLPAIDVRTVGATKPSYRVAWSDYLEFCKTRKADY
jgi:excisionase family DNA binding protein